MRGKIRLLVDGHSFDHPHESTAIFLRGLYTHLQHDDAFELFIAAYDIEKLKLEFGNSGNITYVKLSSKSKYKRLLFDIPALIKRYDIDVAHFQYISPFRKTTKEIVTIHDLLYKDFKQHFPLWYRIRNDIFFRRSAIRADMITSVSNYSLNAIHRHFKIPFRKMVLVPNGISNDFFEVSEFLDVVKKYSLKRYILCVSRIEPRKNHLLLVRAYFELRLFEQNLKLVFVGRQDLPVKELNEYLKSLPAEVQQSIIHLTSISLVELKNLYLQASIVVYPSLGEGFGIPPLEAAALGAKVLCSSATAMADFVFFRESLFNPYNLEEIKRKILFNLDRNDANEREIVRDCIRLQYDWKPIARNFGEQVKKLFS